MEKKYLFASIAMFAFLVSSCNNDETVFDDNEIMVKMSFSANMANPVDSDDALSRTTIDYGKEHTWNSVSFDSEESISILPLTATSSSNYEFKNSASNTGTFIGTVTETDAEAAKFLAVYPYSSTNRVVMDDESCNGTLYFEIPQNQTVKDKDVSFNTSFAIFDKDATESVSLLNNCALIRIVFRGNQNNLSKIRKLRILGGGYKCAGGMKQGIKAFSINGSVDYSSGEIGDINVTHVDGENKFVIDEEYYVVIRPTKLKLSIGAYLTGKPSLAYLYQASEETSFTGKQVYTYEITIP